MLTSNAQEKVYSQELLGTARPGERWELVQSGLRKMQTPRGPWFQYRNVVGFEWNTYEVMIHDLPQALSGFRILHIADLHCRDYWTSAYDQLIGRLHGDPPDLILFTGDLVEDKFNPAPALPIARRLISSLESRLGLFAVRGNHDLRIHRPSLVGTGCRLIDGEVHVISSEGAALELIGARPRAR